jgi:hypothetical protein
VDRDRHTSSSRSSGTSDWRRAYELVLCETSKHALFKRIEAAEAAILSRRNAMLSSADHPAERKALADALAHVRFLKKSRLGFDGPEDEDPCD